MKTNETRTPLLRRAAATALGGIMLVSAAAPANAQDMPFASKIRLENGFPAFHGKVKSDSPDCIANRKVRLFKEKSGPDKLLGKDRTDSAGEWEILKTPRPGVYYAKVNEFGQETPQLVCLADKSNKVAID